MYTINFTQIDASLWPYFIVALIALIAALPRMGAVLSLITLYIKPSSVVIIFAMLFATPFSYPFQHEMQMEGFFGAVWGYLGCIFFLTPFWLPLLIAAYFDYKNRSGIFRWRKP